MEQGTGKTKVTIDIAANLYAEGRITWAVVVAPNGVHSQWCFEQIPAHHPGEYDAVAYDAGKWWSQKAQRRVNSWLTGERGLKWLCVNVEAFTSDRFMEELRRIYRHLGGECLAVVDESTRIKSPKAKRTKTLHKFGKACAYRGILTGTPVTNSPFDLWSQMEFLHPDFFGCNYFMFTHKYGLQIKQTGGTHTYHRAIKPSELRSIHSYAEAGKTPEEIAVIMRISESSVQYILHHPEVQRPYKNLHEIKDRIRPLSFIVKKADCLDLPEKIMERVPVQMSPEQRKAYNDLKRTYLALHDGKELSIENKLTLTIRLQQITGGFFPYQVDEEGREIEGAEPIQIGKVNVKVARLLEDLEEIGEESVIIWAQFRAEIRAIRDAIADRFPDWPITCYFGETPMKDRQQIREDFQAGRIKVFIAHPRSAGVGLNLQRASLHYFYSNGFSLEDRLQAEDRSHRIGQHNPVVYKDVFAENTIDDRISRVLADRRDVLEYFRAEPPDDIF